MTRTAGTVLAADDDSDMRSLYGCWLDESRDVRLAADGEAALERLDETVDVVLLDRQMPGTDGVAVAREIDRSELDPAVVMISGVEPGLELLDISVDDYLQKPVTRETVLDSVRRARAIAEQSRPRRHLLSLDRRRRIVEASVPTRALADSAYQQAVDTLERHSDTLTQARRALTAERDDQPDTPKSSLRNSP